MKKEPVMEFCLLSVGVLFGALVPAIEGLAAFGSGSMSGTQLLTVLVAFSALAISITTGFFWFRRSKSKTSLVGEIRSRPKIPLVSQNSPTG